MPIGFQPAQTQVNHTPFTLNVCPALPVVFTFLFTIGTGILFGI